MIVKIIKIVFITIKYKAIPITVKSLLFKAGNECSNAPAITIVTIKKWQDRYLN